MKTLALPLALTTFAAPLVPCAHAAKSTPRTDVVAVQTIVPGTPSDKVLLRLNLPVGWKGTRTLTQDQSTAVVEDGYKYTIQEKVSLDVRAEVLSVSPKGDLTLRYTFGQGSAVSDVRSGNGKLEAAAQQSLASRNDSARRVFAAIKGRTIEVTESSRGKMLSVRGEKDFLSSALQAIGTIDSAGKTQVETSLRGLLQALMGGDEATLKAPDLLPRDALGVGGTWERRVETAKRTADVTYTLAGRSKGISTVNLLIALQAPVARSGAAKTSVSGSGTGTMEIDEATGATKRMEVDENMTSDASATHQTRVIQKTRRGRRLISRPVTDTMAATQHLHRTVETVPDAVQTIVAD